MSRAQQARVSGWASLATLAALVVHGCAQTVEVGFDDALLGGSATSGGATSGGATSGGATSGGAAGALGLGGFGVGIGGVPDSASQAGAPGCTTTLCRGTQYECGNCNDDDGDGLVDALDPDCLGPCDDDELGLSTGLAKQSAACKHDCYFDGDNGAGNDKCEWSHACDPLSVAPDYPPSGEARCKYGGNMGKDCESLEEAQSPTCTETCLPLVPNGCDCFGCCELPGGSGSYHYLGSGRGDSGCQRDTLDDPLACPPCTPVPSCFNECAECETCVDKLPDPSCNRDNACAAGEAACGPDEPCEFGDYCVTGCCVQAPKPT